MKSKDRLNTEELVAWSQDLPEVLLKEWNNYTDITFKGRGFAWVNHEENVALIKGRHDERAALIATAPDVYEAGWQSASTAWVLVHLDRADPDEVKELLEEAWRMTATKKVIAAYDARS